MNQQIGKLEIESYEKDGVLFAKCTRPAPKARFSKIKTIWHYRFKSEEQRSNYIKVYVARIQEEIDRKEAAKAKKKALLANPENAFKVGEILYNSWGYEQTNIDWYEVVEVLAKSVKIRPIASTTKETGFMCGDSAPIPGKYIGEPVTKMICAATWDSNEPYYLKSKYGWMTKWKNENVYTSWYA